jgi:hypothetical protein
MVSKGGNDEAISIRSQEWLGCICSGWVLVIIVRKMERTYKIS